MTKANLIITAIAICMATCGRSAFAQDTIGHSATTTAAASKLVYLPFAQFQIPFDVDASGSQPASVVLMVSTDNGTNWQALSRANPKDKHFDFRAAAEGEYLFTVQTVDTTGLTFPSPNPPLRVCVDTTKPQAVLQADLDHAGNLIVDIRVQDDFVDLSSAILRLRTDRDPVWREVPVTTLAPNASHYEGQVEVLVPQCNEVALVFSIADRARNSGEASLTYAMPRTAAANDLQLASNRQTSSPTAAGYSAPAAREIPGAVSWDVDRRPAALPTQAPPTGAVQSARRGNYPTSPRAATTAPSAKNPGKLANTVLELELSPNSQLTPEEISLPEPQLPAVVAPGDTAPYRTPEEATRDATVDPAAEPAESEFVEHSLDHPYYCRSRTFSLDYSVEALGGTALSEVELWGSEDNGRTWEKWGTDPDRVSPFDVKVGNDGLFGFRMVLVGAGGSVLGNPQPGEDADAWIRVDTQLPLCRITRAVYGVGNEAGMLVIDYTCNDIDLSENGISLAWSVSPEGPWTTIAGGLKNTGLYLWKADPGLPSRVYLKLEGVDKAGNLGVHRLDLPIDTKGLAPRGRIQGVRAIVPSTSTSASGQ